MSARRHFEPARRSRNPDLSGRFAALEMTFAAGLLLAGSAVGAVEVEPARLEWTIPADQPTRQTLTLRNPRSEPVRIRLSTGPYRLLPPELTLPSAEGWITFDPPEVTLGPGAETEVGIHVSPPASVVGDADGEYLAALLVDELPAGAGAGAAAGGGPHAGTPHPEGGGARITVVPRLALPAYLMIAGRRRVDLEIRRIDLDLAQPETDTESGDTVPALLRADTHLTNRGSVHLRPTGTLALFDGEGRIVRGSSLGGAIPVLPSATLRVPVLLTLPPPGRYRLVVTVEPEPGAALIQAETSFEVTEAGEVSEVRDASSRDTSRQ